MRILVMDDYRPHGESLAELLQQRGHEAIYAQSYADVEWLLELFRFDLALLDFDMPSMSGPAVAAKLSERRPALRSVILSAHVPQGPRHTELGDLLFLQKPVAVQALWDLLQTIEREQAGSSLVIRSFFSLTKHEEPREGFPGT